MKPILEIQNISKKFKINHEQQPYLSLRDSLFKFISPKSTEDFWALKNVNITVEQGDTLGIIGRNGAGKSTLLKILSKITPPTSGKIISRGRIASLLEVGTGFHPELTGRENVFMNGSILGMRKKEITKNFDAIVDFAGVEKFIDTPLKHYSSGMQLRLAFAVAAFLENEILIIDEVLAVGDAEFQKKCLGKMNEISKEDGRTLLFVSHNLAATQNLCEKSILMDEGTVVTYDKTEYIIDKYLTLNNTKTENISEIKIRKGNGNLRFNNGVIRSLNSNTAGNVESFSETVIELSFDLNQNINIKSSKIDIGINNIYGERVAWLSSDTISYKLDLFQQKVSFVIYNLPLSPGNYCCTLYAEINNEICDWINNVLYFQVIEKDYYHTGKIVPSGQGNIILNYTIKNDTEKN